MAELVYPNTEEAPYGVARLGEKYTLIDIFDKFPKEERSFVNYYSYLAFSAIIGAVVPIGLNNLMGKKLYYKPFITLLSSGSMYLATKAIFYYRDVSSIRTEAICRDYIRLHPDRFPPIGKFDCPFNMRTNDDNQTFANQLNLAFLFASSQNAKSLRILCTSGTQADG